MALGSSRATPREQFRDFLEASGIDEPDPDTSPGKHRARTFDDKRGEKSAVYKYFDDGDRPGWYAHDYRTGATITLLWAGLAKYMLENRYEYLVGCASIGMADGGHAAASVYAGLAEHMSPLEYRVFPRCPLPLAALKQDLTAEIPPLIKGYVRAGAYICGDPAWDIDFNTADLPILLPMSRINARYARHFFGGHD